MLTSYFHIKYAHNSCTGTIQLKSLLSVFAILMALGCTSTTKIVETPDIELKSMMPVMGETENAYYRYLLSLRARSNDQTGTATQEMEKAVILDPDSSYLKKELAALWSQDKQYGKALNILEDVLRQYNGDDRNVDIDALVMAGQIHLAQNDKDAAISKLEKAVAIDSSREDIYHTLGNIYMQEEDHQNALRIYQLLVNRHPASYVGHFFLGRVYTELNRVSEAEASFQKTLALAPELDEPRFRLIDLYQSRGQKEKSEALYRQILSGNQRNTRALMGLALLNHHAGKIKAATKQLKQLGVDSKTDKNIVPVLVHHYVDNKKYDDALVLIEGMLTGAPDSATLHYLAALAYDEKKQDNKAKALHHFRQVDPDSEFYKNAALQVGYILNEMGKPQEAISHVKAVIQQMPDSSEPYLYLGIFQEDLKEYEAAIESIQKGLAIEPESVPLLFRLGVISDKAGYKNECIAAMKKVIALNPDHANALNYLGYTYADQGKNLIEAEKLILKALKIKPEDGYITDSLGWVYYQDKQYAKALEVLLRAVELVPDDPIILEHAGDAYLKTNNRLKAIEFYRRSLKLKKEDKEGIEKKLRDLSAE